MDAPSTLPSPPAPASIFNERLGLHLLLFGVTFCSVAWITTPPPNVPHFTEHDGLVFACSLLLILLSHELGHYIAGRIHGVSITLPYFIPVPIGIGTLGAVIRIRAEIPNRNALIDIGAAGPIAGMVVAIPFLLWGTAHSHYEAVGYEPGAHFPGRMSVLGLLQLGHQAWSGTTGVDVIEHLQKALSLFGKAALPDKFVPWSGDNLLSLGVTRFFLGPGGPHQDVSLHPAANAAWFGMLVTLLNLMPMGQLDGGHVTYALFGKRAALLGRVVSWGLLGLVFFASIASWLAWLALVRGLIGLNHPPVTYPFLPLKRSRIAIAAVALILLVLVFMPVPIEPRPVP